MGRELQKKKRRSHRQPIRQHTSAKKILNPRGNDMVAKSWNKKETMSQNYKRLGLVARLGAPTGGVEKLIHEPKPETGTAAAKSKSKLDAALTIASLEESIISEARVERDADGKIIRVIHSKVTSARNTGTGALQPLHDPLNELDSDSESDAGAEEGGQNPEQHREDQHGSKWEEWAGIEDENDTEVVRSLVRESRTPGAKKVRHQSEREREWLERLVNKWGDDFGGMARDARLNPMQQTASDIRRRLAKLEEGS